MGNRSNCQFEYDKDWLTDGFSLSPLKLPLKAGLFTADYQPFNGNFGVFEDSLPGGYGEYLLRKVLKGLGENGFLNHDANVFAKIRKITAVAPRRDRILPDGSGTDIRKWPVRRRTGLSPGGCGLR